MGTIIPPKMIEDGRRIWALHLGPVSYGVPENGGLIVAYHENGDGAPVVWFAIYDGNSDIVRRINSRHVQVVEYHTPVEG